MHKRPTRRKALVVISLGLMTLFAGLTAQVKAAATGSVKITQDFANRKLQIEWTAIPNVGSFRVTLDDSPALRQPILSEDVGQNHLTLDVLEGGLAYGITYYVRIEPGEMQDRFRLTVPSWPESYLNYAYLRKTWETTGRKWLTTYSGVNWNEAAHKWDFDPQWAAAKTDAAQDAYNLEYTARAGVNMGLICHDLPLLNELAEFFLAYHGRFTNLGEMRRMKSATVDTSNLDGQGEDSARNLIWVIKQGTTSRVLTCDLCMSQFFHPVARLIRVITMLPEAERTPAMKAFVSRYAPLIVHDHLLRLLYGQDRLVESTWKRMIASPTVLVKLYAGDLTDRELWEIGTAAEMLGANANDPVLVPLQPEEEARLQEAVQLGVTALARVKTYYPDTQNFKGQTVGSVSYFNGIWYNQAAYAYSGYTGASFPTEKDKKLWTEASWDIGHAYRIPVFLRSLYDNRKATGVDFPSARDVELLTNQLMYRVFQGNFVKPLFNNFLDGSNGWYRVGYHGPNFGYPPAQYCGGQAGQPCMTDAALMGWGLIAFFNPDLMELEHSLANLAWRDDPETKLFKDRYYQYVARYDFKDANGQWQYPVLLLWVLAGTPQRLQGCGAP